MNDALLKAIDGYNKEKELIIRQISDLQNSGEIVFDKVSDLTRRLGQIDILMKDLLGINPSKEDK